MSGWMTFWVCLLVGSVVGFAGLLVSIAGGAFRELRQMLEELNTEHESAVSSDE